MLTQQIILNKIIADEGKILTDGEIYGRIIFLGKDRKASEFHEISEEEYNEILKLEDEANLKAMEEM